MRVLFAAVAVVCLAIGFPALAQSQAQTQRTQLTPYRISPGDDLEIFVWGEDRLQRMVTVLPDGTFSFPLVGKIDAAGALPSEIEAKISKGLEPQYRGAVPQITVMVRKATGMQFSVVGKVRAPGTFTPGHYVNALEALTMAGGPADFAQLGNIVIIRKTGGRTEAIRVRLNDILKGSVSDVSSSNIPQLQSGDTIVVP